jgi:hypothetical protein
MPQRGTCRAVSYKFATAVAQTQGSKDKASKCQGNGLCKANAPARKEEKTHCSSIQITAVSNSKTETQFAWNKMYLSGVT